MNAPKTPMTIERFYKENAPDRLFLQREDGCIEKEWTGASCGNDDVEYIRADIREAQIDALKAENAALHAECDRLTAMLGPQKPMSAEEVTQPGFYWHRYGTEDWCVVDVDFGYPYRLFIGTDGELAGQFIGPIRLPGVSNA